MIGEESNSVTVVRDKGAIVEEGGRRHAAHATGRAALALHTTTLLRFAASVARLPFSSSRYSALVVRCCFLPKLPLRR